MWIATKSKYEKFRLLFVACLGKCEGKGTQMSATLVKRKRIRIPENSRDVLHLIWKTLHVRHMEAAHMMVRQNPEQSDN